MKINLAGISTSWLPREHHFGIVQFQVQYPTLRNHIDPSHLLVSNLFMPLVFIDGLSYVHVSLTKLCRCELNST